MALFGLAFALYARTMPPTVLDGDSGEYQHMAYYLGVPHSTGYPLYILLAKLFTFLPVGDVAFRVNLLSVVCAALTAPFVYAIALRLTARRVPAILATLVLVVTPSMWGAAVQAEVYALHLLLGVLATLLALRWHQDGARRDFYTLAFVLGLGLTNHRVFFFALPAFALLVWFNRRRLAAGMIARGIILGALPLLLYAYLPLRADQLIAQQDPANWDLYKREDAILKGQISAYYRHTPDGFFNLVTGFDNRNKLGFKSPLDEANRVNLAAALLAQQFGVAGIAFALGGAWLALRRNRQEFFFLLTLSAGVGFIAIYLRGMSTVYYFSLAYLPLALWSGFGFAALLRRAARVPIKHFTRTTTVVLLLLPLSMLVANFAALDESDYFIARDYAQAVLRDDLAPNAVVIAPWEISESLRYYQFVENQRPDVLVTMISPIWPQWERLMTRARELNRPFYNVEFFPETRGAPERFVQAVPLPLPSEPRPQYALRDATIVPETQVLGFDLAPDPPQPGNALRVRVYYRTLARMYPMYSAMLGISDANGKPVGDYEGFPGSYYYPTYRWQAGDFYRSAWTITLPADAPAGEYRLDLYWHVYNLDARQADYTRETHVALGVIRVGDFGVARIDQPAQARLGEAITFLGWNGSPSVARGQSLDLDLVWRAERALTEAYTVFVHLVDANGNVVADADSPPFTGLYPTNRWRAGETLRDRHTLKIPADLAPGNYALEIGMYAPATGARLPVSGGADKIDLAPLGVK